MIPTLIFGRTNHESTRTIFGATAFWEAPQKDVDATMDLILQQGINHVDTAASYGQSEVLLGDWIKRNGRPFFLASKTGERTKQAAYDSIRTSLDRLHVSQLDMIQLHALHTEDEWQTAFSAGGALEALVQARDEGLARFIGVTGHGVAVPEFHLRSLEQFDFDSVLLPFNYPMMQNREYAADFEALVALCRERNVAVQTIKAITRSPWDDRPHSAATWYEPLTEQADIDLAVHWVFGRPGVFLNTAGDIHVLPKVLDAASRYREAPSDEAMARLAAEREMAPLFV